MVPENFPKLSRPVAPTIPVSAPFGEKGALWDWTLDADGLWHNYIVCAQCQGHFTRLSSCACGKRDGLGQHKGIDFRAPVGTMVFAMVDGVVEAAGYENPADPLQGFGLRIRQSFEVGGERWRAFYGHLSHLHVKSGDAVRTAQLIGLSGGTGHVSGPHLHVELRSPQGQQVPLEFFPKT